ncbi:short-chain dehydrogenase/reductase 3 isoform X2 [Zalophus californianus]|uniref:Short-chain dehydrogenase/reductase 3 n=1 Tax=Zalophus californianus TaxID=9704 RepID=A0A6P9F7I0_ZALCA|nr:short-chain dehydrogenase/reductase 3 isoform X2 [Zalophus californianus]
MHMIYLVAKAAVGLVLPAKLRDLSRENVLITGGGRGIGRQLAREFAERGARKIVLWGRTEKCLKETTEEIRQMGTECHYFICDVGNREEVYQTAKAVREKVGDITILVNNAAVVHGKSLMDSDDDALLKSQHINTLGQFWTTKAFLPRMLELQNGHIVCLNSVLALSAIPGAIDYCTSKASAFAFMESLTLGLLDCPGVSATTVLPFHTSTEMFQGMRVSHNSYFINAAAFGPQQPRESALVPISQTWELRLRGAKLLAQGHTEGNRLNMLLPQVWAASVGVPQPLPAAEARDGGPEDGGSRAAQSGPAPPPVDHACPHYLEKHTPTGCTGGDLQILRNLHLHEHFQRADIKAGCRDTLASHGT